MPVLSMNEVAWDESNVMLSNGQEMSGIRQPSGLARSQDDAMVGYFFQRPQTDVAQPYNKRWAVGDDSVIEHGRNVGIHELDRDFQNMGFETHREGAVGTSVYSPAERFTRSRTEIASNAKKIWDADMAGKAGGDPKAMFAPSNPWMPRDDTWGNTPQPRHNHAVSNPMHIAHRRPGSFPGSDPASILSPRSSETGALGVNMAEYVLGGSPVGKDLLRRQFVAGGGDDGQKVNNDKGGKAASPFEGGDKSSGGQDPNEVQSNGIMQNGQDDKLYRPGAYNRTPGSRQNSPTEEDGRSQPVLSEPAKMPPQHQLAPKLEDYVEVHQQLPQHGLNLDPPQFEPVGIDPIQFDYSQQLMPPSMESPNFNMDYSQQLNPDYQAQLLQRQQQQQQQQQQQPPMAILTQQQYAIAAQQQQLGLGPTATTFTPAPYVLGGQDPYAVGIPIAAAGPTAVVHPQYYSVQTPWGIYPAAGLLQQSGNNQQVQQQQQQQILRGSTGRLTPSQDGLGTPTGNLQSQPATIQPAAGTAGYQILAPAYYDQNGQLVMSTGRGMSTPVRLVSPAPILVNAGGQQGTTNGLGANQLRLLTTQQQPVQGSPVYTSSNNTPQNTPLGQAYTPNSASLYTPVTNSAFNPISSTLGLGQQQTGYNSTNLGSIGSNSAPGAIGTDMENLLQSQLVGAGLPAAATTPQRRDSLSASLDYTKSRQQQLQGGLPPSAAAAAAALGPYYGLGGAASLSGGPLGLVSSANHSLTPPPNLSGSAGLGLGGNRLYSAAPGAEAKYRNGSLSNTNGLFGNSLFPSRILAKSASMSKEVTGRSRLLEDFRNNRIPNLQLKDLVNHVVEFSQDQHGSRFIQQKLERATPAEKVMVFGEILTAAYSLMTDVFGNYVIQKFFEFGTPEQKQTLAQRVRGHVLPLALQMYGCRVIQKALESIPPEMQVEIVKELDGHVLKCVKDQNGNHVVQKCIECVEPKHLQFIIDAFKTQVFSLSTHPYGCRVIQRILEHCTGEQTTPILEELHSHTERLVQDQYGNYVIQHVLEHGRPEDKSKIVGGLRGKVLVLSQHKFASNVVEKCVSHSSRAERAFLIDEICSMNDGALYTMMKDQFANYVVQKMIDVAEPAQRKLLMHKIRPHVATLRKYTYGKHILAKLEKYYMKNADLGPIGMPPNGALQ